ncbi:TPA: hypothetical protein ACMDNU_003656 [Vibrio cholerae]
MSEDEEFNNDEELAPMVDGLSGALCVLILISTVFMISSTSKVFEEITGSYLQFKDSSVDLDNNIITFNEGLMMNSVQQNEISGKINSLPGEEVVFHVFMPDETNNRNRKMIYNMLYFKSKINVDKKIKMKIGTKDICNNNSSCIYWEVN